MLVQQNTQATASAVDPMMCVLLVVCALAIVVMLMIQRGRATPELRVPTAAALNAELEAMATFRRLMTPYLNREPNAPELDDERRRLACQAYVQEHGYSPLSRETTPHPSPNGVEQTIVLDPPGGQRVLPSITTQLRGRRARRLRSRARSSYRTRRVRPGIRSTRKGRGPLVLLTSFR